MSRQTRRATKKILVLLLLAVTALSGCHPTQPFYLFEKGDLQHYIDTATEIEYPDVNEAALAEASGSQEPRTVINPHFDEFWDLSLEEAICIALKNSKVIRTFGLGSTSRVGQGLASIVPDRLLSGIDAVQTVYDPAIIESNPGSIGAGRDPAHAEFPADYRSQTGGATPDLLTTNGETGVEAALSAFDASLVASTGWDRTDQAQNVTGFGQQFQATQSDSIRNLLQITKRTATGGRFTVTTRADYLQSSAGVRAVPSDWTADLRMEAQHHLLAGAGTQINRMGVMVARINADQSLADFEAAVRNLVSDVEWAYWDLNNQYRALDAQKAGRDSALVSWKKVKTKAIVGVPGGEAEKEAQARQQYFRFRSQVETALHTVFQTENRLRYIMGLAATDRRMIRPADEPVTAAVKFDWCQVLSESLFRSPELRRQKWRIKRRELEVILAKNMLLPRLDAIARYRWLGVGDQLIEANRRGLNFPADGSLAWDELTEGKFQEAEFGLEFEMPIGFRRASSAVRWAELSLAREKARLDEMELELSHALTSAYQDVETFYQNMQTNYNWRVAAQKEVDAVLAAFEAGTVTLDLLLRAQQSRADAETAYYNSLKEYNLAIARVHFRKGSLLEYNSVNLAEGAWPCKAYYDAMAHARRRDASHYLNYGFTRPRVISRGEYSQFQNGTAAPGEYDPQSLDAPLQLEEVPPGVETLEVPPMPEPQDVDTGAFPRRAPAETATRPMGPELAPPVLRPASGTSAGGQPIGAGLKLGAGQSYDWGVLESRLPGDANSSTGRPSFLHPTRRPENHPLRVRVGR